MKRQTFVKKCFLVVCGLVFLLGVCGVSAFFSFVGTAHAFSFVVDTSNLYEDISSTQAWVTVGNLYDDFDDEVIIGLSNGRLSMYSYDETRNEFTPVLHDATEYLVSSGGGGFIEVSGGNAVPLVANVNGKGNNELLVGSGSGWVYLYKYDEDSSPYLPEFSGSAISDDTGARIDVGSNAIPTFGDVDNDASDELVIGCEEGYVYIYNRDESGNFSGGRINTTLGELDVGAVSMPVVLDVDHDDKNELVVAMASGQIGVYSYSEVGGRPYYISQGNLKDEAGHDIDEGANPKIAFGNVDQDDGLDLVVGNEYGEVNYYEANADGSFSLIQTLALSSITRRAFLAMGNIFTDGWTGLVIAGARVDGDWVSNVEFWGNDCDDDEIISSLDDDDYYNSPVWYHDKDGDGYGKNDDSVHSCHGARSGYVEKSTDCDDEDSQVNPDATEICDGQDNDCDGSTDEGAVDAVVCFVDKDGDKYGDASKSVKACPGDPKYVTIAGDCDDTNEAINPGATESCDGVDNNCDGKTDNAKDALVWYKDVDGDEYGTSRVSTRACKAPTGYVANNTDCNDSQAAINPAATESCDGVDNDCDGSIDEGVALKTFYQDVDGDTYGNAAVSKSACSTPTRYVVDNTDCNDSQAAINPAATEICNGVDDNCSGSADDSATDIKTWYKDVDGDSFGGKKVSTQACTQPAGFVFNNKDCDDTSAGINPTATEVCDLKDNDCDGSINEGLTCSIPVTDVDGDGYEASADCNDTDPAINPGATDVCEDTIDQDCDGSDLACTVTVVPDVPDVVDTTDVVDAPDVVDGPVDTTDTAVVTSAIDPADSTPATDTIGSAVVIGAADGSTTAGTALAPSDTTGTLTETDEDQGSAMPIVGGVLPAEIPEDVFAEETGEINEDKSNGCSLSAHGTQTAGLNWMMIISSLQILWLRKK